ncbi:hypothetical protein Ahy_A10g048173 isoform B [Arachis hypogaea]|uniref:Uncharacterized protein n=1 Tax=Arachis hypogaea TaxID=3818 RepID=A0A445B4H0_ARAHY|nr:hypothetical protein Ahy_A10g048173 isoform B [Arachis hypogaea]
MDNLKDDRKRRSLDRYGSVSSAVSAMFLGCRMAEAKERKLTPSVPSDMQAVLKRCETLEKEVYKTDRRPSEAEQELADEKERLLEEIERMLSENGKI